MELVLFMFFVEELDVMFSELVDELDFIDKYREVMFVFLVEKKW